MTPQILLIDDDVRLAEMLKEYLFEAHYHVIVAHTGSDGAIASQVTQFDAVILDLMLPDKDGLDICRELRSHSDIPILMLTAKGDPMDRVVGLEMGADDYLPKPFEPRELLARLKAIMRRRAGSNEQKQHRFGALEVDSEAMEVRLAGRRCTLTSYQFKLLEVLANGAGRVLSREYLMDQLQGSDLEAFDRSIDVHISRIRSEIEEDPKHPKRVITVRGVGYVFAKVQE